MAVGGEKMKPQDDRRIPLDPGTHAVTIDDVVSGVSDKTGNAYWIVKLLTENEVQFDHFIACEETQYKSIDKVFKSASEQMESLLLYDKIGEQESYEKWFEQAIDLTFALKGKKIEYSVQKYKIDGKEGFWGKITGFLDTPNEAVQVVPKDHNVKGPTPGVDPNEEINF